MIYPGEPIFDDDTPEEAHAAPDGYGKGWTGASESGYGDSLSDFPDELLIPESEWQARIEEREANGWQLSQQMIAAGLPCKDQAQTQFCWCNAPVHALEIIRVQQNEPMIPLSPASVACPINGFRNQGGWDNDAITRLQKFGAVPSSSWPPNAIDRRYYTKANMAAAVNFEVVKWVKLKPRNINQAVSLLLNDKPVPMGLPWWEHEVTGYDAVWVNGQIGFRPRNSWGMKYGHLGFFILQGSKMQFGTAVCPLVVSTAA